MNRDQINREILKAVKMRDLDTVKKLAAERKAMDAPEGGVGGFLAKGLASGASSVVDLAFSLYKSGIPDKELRESLPSEPAAQKIESGIDYLSEALTGEKLIPQRRPEGFAERAAQIAGETVGSAPYFYGGAAALGKAGVGGAKALFDAARARKGATLAAESASVVGAAAGGEIAESAFPESDYAPMLGELAGGISAPMLSKGLAVPRKIVKKGAEGYWKIAPMGYITEKMAEVALSNKAIADSSVEGFGKFGQKAVKRNLGKTYDWAKDSQKTRAISRIENMMKDLSPEAKAELQKAVQGDARQGLGGLSWMQKTGNKELMQLEAEIMSVGTDPRKFLQRNKDLLEARVNLSGILPYEESGESIARSALQDKMQGLKRTGEEMAQTARGMEKEALDQIGDSARASAFGEIDEARNVRAQRREAVRSGLDQRVESSRARVRAARGQIGDHVQLETKLELDEIANRMAQKLPTASREEISAELAQRLEGAYERAIEVEKEVWRQLEEVKHNTGLPVIQANIRKAISSIPGDVGDEVRKNNIVRRYMSQDSEKRWGSLGVPLNEMTSDRNRLGDKITDLLKKGQREEAWAYMQLRDGILDAIDTSSSLNKSDMAEALRLATKESNDLREIFHKGELKKFLGLEDARPSAKLDPNLFMQSMTRSRGIKGGLVYDDLVNAVGETEAQKGVRDYLMNDFQRKAFKQGRYSQPAVESFIKDNQELLAKIPNLEGDIRAISIDQDAINRGTRTLEEVGRISRNEEMPTAAQIRSTQEKLGLNPDEISTLATSEAIGAISPEERLRLGVARFGSEAKGFQEVQKKAESWTKAAQARTFKDEQLDASEKLINSIEKAVLKGDVSANQVNRLKVDLGADDATIARIRQKENAGGALSVDERMKMGLDQYYRAVKRREMTDQRVEKLKRAMAAKNASGITDFVNAPSGKGIEALKRSRDPVQAAATVRKVARSVPGGERALKESVFEDIWKKASDQDLKLWPADESNALSPNVHRVLNGKKLTQEILTGRNKSFYKEILGSEEFGRLEKIINEINLVESALQMKAKSGRPVGDLYEMIASFPARLLGVYVGKKIASATGTGSIQVPGFTANIAEKLMKKVNLDTAHEMLIQMVEDPKLFEAAFKGSYGKSLRSKKESIKKLNSWLAAPGRRFIEAQEYGEEE